MAYITELEATNYAAARGVTLTGDVAVMIQRAHDYIESFTFKGQRASDVITQRDSFPRTGLYLDGYELPVDEVPIQIKAAESEAVILINSGIDLMAIRGRAVKREKVDVLETEYMDGADTLDYYTSVMAFLKPFLKNSGVNTAVVRV